MRRLLVFLTAIVVLSGCADCTVSTYCKHGKAHTTTTTTIRHKRS